MEQLMSARLRRFEPPRGDHREFASHGSWASETIAQDRDCPSLLQVQCRSSFARPQVTGSTRHLNRLPVYRILHMIHTKLNMQAFTGRKTACSVQAQVGIPKFFQ